MLDALIASAVLAAAPAPGTPVTYMLGSLPRCARVVSIDTGPDQRPWAWIVGGHPPQWVFHVPVEELRAGCGEERREARR